MKEYRDHYFKRAKKDNYPARSVYKLQEIDKRFKIFKPGMKVMDLGAAPGSWTMCAAEKVGPRGRVLSADIQTTEQGFDKHVTFMQEDVFERSDVFEQAIADIGPFNVVISDMAPRTTGHKFTDQARSANLCFEALAVATYCLIKGGSFVVKIFMGPDVEPFVKEMRKHFKTVKAFKPKSSRAESKETFYVGMDFKGPAEESETDPQQ